MKTIPVLLFLICFCGCSPQKTLAHRLKGADRAVYACVLKDYEEVKTTVTGDDVNKVVEAIAHGRKLSRDIKAAFGFQLEFFKGSEHLATINTSGQAFWVGDTPYEDTTKTLKRLYEKAHEGTPKLSP